MILRATAAILALVVVFGAVAPGNAASVAETLVAKSDSLRKLGESTNGAVVDSTSVAAPLRIDSSWTGSNARASDSTKVSSDSLASGAPRVPADSATHKRSLPPRTLTLRQQVMFAGGFMAFIALMMASMQNFNP